MKVLIIYATAGIGHKKAAFAIKEAFDRKGKDAHLIDVLDYTTKFFKFFYNSVYLFLVKRIPLVWGFFYYILDNPYVYAVLSPFRRLTNFLNSKKFVKYLMDKRPDVVITTHFFASEVIANLKKKNLFNTRLITVITDYQSHKFWLSDYIDMYIVASDDTKKEMTRRGIESNKIRVFGIPCSNNFSKEHNTENILKKLNLLPNKKTLFVLGGGFGVGPIKEIVTHLDGIEEDFQAMVVCGYNKALFRGVSDVVQSAKHSFKVFGFVDNIDEMMSVSDILVSKPGGITVTEALNAKLPMIVIDPIPGQEMRNYRFLERNGAATRIKAPKEIAPIVQERLHSDKLEVLKNNVKKIRLVDSAERIVDEISK